MTGFFQILSSSSVIKHCAFWYTTFSVTDKDTKQTHSPSGEVWIPLFAACDFSAPGALLAGVDSWLPSSELTPPEMPLSPDTLPPGDGPSAFWVPGSAGKSSELIVNSLASAVGCLTIPTEINTIHNFKLFLPAMQFETISILSMRSKYQHQGCDAMHLGRRAPVLWGEHAASLFRV